jgi:hypothetical protein
VKSLFQQLAEGRRSSAVKERVKFHVAANAWGEIVPIDIAQRADLRRAVLLANLAIIVAASVVQAGVAFLGHVLTPFFSKWLLGALVQCQKVVVPHTISVRADIWTIWSIDHSHICSSAVYHGVKRVCPRIDGFDDVLPGPLPVIATQMGDALMSAVARLLVDAGHLNIGHSNSLSHIDYQPDDAIMAPLASNVNIARTIIACITRFCVRN